MDELRIRVVPTPWNKGKLVGQKAPLKFKEIWAIRVRLQVFRRTRELALFGLGIDSKLRACDLLKLKVRDVRHGERIAVRAIVVQQKTSRPVQFEITESTRTALVDWIRLSGLASENFLFPSRVRASPHLSVRQYARIVDSWVEEIGLDPAAYGTHSIRRTKPSLIYRRTKNLRAVQLLLGHTKLESTVRYLGIGGAQHCEATRPRALNAETFPLTTTSVDAAIRNDRFTSTPAGERPRAKFPARSTPVACSATCSKTNHSTRVWPHSYPLPTSGLRSLPPQRERRCHGRHAPSNSRGRASPRRRRRDAPRKDGPNLPVPQHAQEAHGCRLLPHRSFDSTSRRQADEGYGSRPTRIGRQADRLRARSRPPDPFPQPSGPPDRPGSTRSQASRTGGCSRRQCGGRGGSRARASRDRMSYRR